MTRVKIDDYIWGLASNQYVPSSFRGNWTIFAWDITNKKFDRKKL